MCFSALVSFLAATLLLSIGIATLMKVTRVSELPFAVLPFFFSIQQFSEGLLWVLLPRGGPPNLITAATYTFLTFAFLIYPVWMPLSIWALEKDTLRRKLIMACGFIGILWSIAGAHHVITHGGIPQIHDSHIYYSLGKPFLPKLFAVLLYGVATIMPFFIARWWPFKLFGALLALSCILSYTIWHYYFVSVWCFFVALLSLGVYSLISAKKETGIAFAGSKRIS